MDLSIRTVCASSLPASIAQTRENSDTYPPTYSWAPLAEATGHLPTSGTKAGGRLTRFAAASSLFCACSRRVDGRAKCQSMLPDRHCPSLRDPAIVASSGQRAYAKVYLADPEAVELKLTWRIYRLLFELRFPWRGKSGVMTARAGSARLVVRSESRRSDGKAGQNLRFQAGRRREARGTGSRPGGPRPRRAASCLQPM